MNFFEHMFAIYLYNSIYLDRTVRVCDITNCNFPDEYNKVFFTVYIYIIKQDIEIYVPSGRPNGWTEWAEILNFMIVKFILCYKY